MINSSLQTIIHRLFNSVYSYGSPIVNDLSFQSNGVFRAFLSVNFIEGKAEIPVVMRSIVEPDMDINTTSIVLPLYKSGTYVKRTKNSIMGTLLSGDSRHRLLEVSNSKGDFTYYGGKGFILDKDFNILFLAVLGVTKDSVNISYNYAKIYISPKVFTSKGPIESLIIKDVIPLLSEISFPKLQTNVRIKNNISTPDTFTFSPEIVIADVTDKFIVLPEKPNTDNPNKDINEFLLNNLDDILTLSRFR